LSLTPFEQFSQNIAYARNMVTGGRALEGLHGIGANYGDLAAAHPEDLYRAAWSQAVSALDHWLHQEVLEHAVALVRSDERPLPDRLSKLRMPFATVEQMTDNSVGSVFAEFIEEETRRDTYQRSKGISEGLRLVTHLNADQIWGCIAEGLGTTAAAARDRQDRIVNRRNRIAHQADLDKDGRRSPMPVSEVEAAVSWIEDVAKQISTILPDIPAEAVQTETPAWLARAGKDGEREEWALQGGVVGGGFNEVGDLTAVDSRSRAVEIVEQEYKGESQGLIRNYAGQLWAFRGKIQIGDLVVLPLKGKKQSRIAIGRVTGDYEFDPAAPEDRRHFRRVEWLRTDVPRKAAGQDLRYTLGAFMTFCELWRNDAAWRLAELARTGRDPGARDVEG
jgi:restriction system protein